MNKNICVYSASSNDIRPEFFEVARELGAEMARNGYALVYGGGCIGLMGVIAKEIHRHGGKVIGVIPEFMQGCGVAYEQADELIIAKDMRERKATMEELGDAFVGLPGGFGTLDEMIEIITLKQLGRHCKPVVFLNALGFWNPLSHAFDHMYQENFVKPYCRELYYFSPNAQDTISHIQAYEPPDLETPWTRKTI